MSKDRTSNVNIIVRVERGLVCLQTYPSQFGANKEGVDGR